ncbi:MAG: hypothetical protein QXE79_00955 [Candidatus Bathyarchaeia archaeon]
MIGVGAAYLGRLDDLIKRMLKAKDGLGEDYLRRLIEEKKKAYLGFLSDEGAAHLVAQDLSVELGGEKFREATPLSSLVQGLSDVTVIGRVITVWPLKRFKRPTGEEGSLLRILLADNSGEVVCALWDPAVEIVELSLQGELLDKALKIIHGYTRGGLRGDLEIHVGEKGEVHLVSEAEAAQLPSLSDYIIPLRNVGDGNVNLRCRIEESPQIRVFARREGGEGKLSRVRISDESAKAILVAWDERAEELSKVKQGETILILNAKAKSLPYGILEIHAGKGTVIYKGDQPPRGSRS